jgi:cbb3-type cytochrome oxidase maturation protein
MSIIYILIPIAIILTSIAIYLFFWAVKTEQFEDLEKQGMSILFDDKDSIDNENSLDKNNQKKNKQNNADTK